MFYHAYEASRSTMVVIHTKQPSRPRDTQFLPHSITTSHNIRYSNRSYWPVINEISRCTKDYASFLLETFPKLDEPSEQRYETYLGTD